jgi:hypothetical protein
MPVAWADALVTCTGVKRRDAGSLGPCFRVHAARLGPAQARPRRKPVLLAGREFPGQRFRRGAAAGGYG